MKGRQEGREQDGVERRREDGGEDGAGNRQHFPQ